MPPELLATLNLYGGGIRCRSIDPYRVVDPDFVPSTSKHHNIVSTAFCQKSHPPIFRVTVVVSCAPSAGILRRILRRKRGFFLSQLP